jgi:hypothetical protein
MSVIADYSVVIASAAKQSRAKRSGLWIASRRSQ